MELETMVRFSDPEERGLCEVARRVAADFAATPGASERRQSVMGGRHSREDLERYLVQWSTLRDEARRVAKETEASASDSEFIAGWRQTALEVEDVATRLLGMFDRALEALELDRREKADKENRK